LGGALAIVGLPLSVAGWLLTSPRFALRQVVVEGTQRVSPAWVERTLQPLRGRHLLRLSLGEAQKLLAGHPWIESVELRRQLPAGLQVRVVERRPVALARQGEALLYIDEAARPIAAFDATLGPSDLPLVSAATSGVGLRPALELAAALAVAAPEWAAELSEIEVLGEEDFRLYTAALPFPLLVRQDTLALQSRRLQELLPEIRRRYPAVAVLDLRFERRIIVQPAAARRPGAGDAPPPPPAPAPPAPAGRVAA
jgi:hypothetical protein